ncbi:uncharacterized protein PGTG_14599 [Puccinia graminis f. sp. tritici CRL 75-36-700-3]|uniref:Up-regulated during septation protein 1 domain-containing protein n=1 Tax=Puccinia graminis f. sp. tritici (strain CRL 75-36-700-3 / race SCCL) TaxID=418459 RepID=E3KUA9_PUCGT|nr:uncharacterized protein PGTG_14599 [Puccinia graminis f. sp. tritici CRL 75-36-700-3]EFP87884.2 hypothetical protein PGTG_14599 [Puccinia graminis f. sp. tritici CRL 75-36-700-3]
MLRSSTNNNSNHSTTTTNQELLNQLSRLSSNLPFSDHHHPHQPSSSSSSKPKTNHGITNNLKLDMMSQLLCSQALLESDSFKLLTYDKFNQTKKAISKLENQLHSINSKINLELKILLATTLIADDNSLNEQHDLYQFPSKFKPLHDQKESIQSQLSELRTSSLQHLVAVLALGFKRLEHQLQHSTQLNHHSSPSHTHFRPPSPALTTLSSRSTNLNSRFDGPHLFANNSSLLNRSNSPSFNQNGSSTITSPDRFPFSSSSSTNNNNNHHQNKETNLLKEEIESLKSLLTARDAIIAEQTSDLSLLELEVETLKQSLSDQSTTHKQQVSDKSNAERKAQIQIDSLRKENSKLSDSLEASREQISSKEQELKLVKKEIEILHSDRQVEQMSALNESLAVQAREAEERAKEALNAQAELESQLETLKADLETTRRSGTRSLDERNSLQQDLQTSQDKLQTALAELETLRTEAAERAAEDGRRYTALEAAHRDEWHALASRLTTLSSKFNNNPASPKLAQFLVQPLQPGQQTKFVEELVRSLDEYISITNELLASTQDLGPTLRAELEQVRRSHEQEKVEWMETVEMLESEKQMLEKSIESERAGERESEELEKVKLEVAGLKQQLVAAKQQEEEQTPNTSVEKALRELWKALPPNLEARAGASLDSDLSSFKAVYEPAPPPAPKNFGLVSAGVSGSLGGLFGLGKRNTPTPSSTSSSDDHHPSQLHQRSSLDFSVDSTLEKLKLLVENDKKLVDRLFKYEAEKDSHKNNSLRAQKLVSESQDALRIYQSQVKELEERLEYADAQSAAMLEKVNDLMESEEKAHMIGRRAEQTIAKYQAELSSLKAQLTTHSQSSSLSGGGGAEKRLKEEVQRLSETVEDLNAEIEDLKAQELKLRDTFLSDLAELNQLNSALKAKNRALERSVKNQ